jgi:hypothetical protein
VVKGLENFLFGQVLQQIRRGYRGQLSTTVGESIPVVALMDTVQAAGPGNGHLLRAKVDPFDVVCVLLKEPYQVTLSAPDVHDRPGPGLRQQGPDVTPVDESRSIGVAPASML